jgi:hypothetical protein
VAVTLTDEDFSIWLRVCDRRPHGIMWAKHYRDGDRRDADMMCEAQQIAYFGPCPLLLYGIEFRGWTLGPRRIAHDVSPQGGAADTG